MRIVSITLIYRVIFVLEEQTMELLSVKQTAEKWGLSPRRIQILCNENRIPGAQRIGYSWVIPASAKKPVDARIKSGKYKKSN